MPPRIAGAYPIMKLFAISDLHLGHPTNREALAGISDRAEDWLILAGDVGETAAHLALAFELLGQRFAQLIWVPGNHELWSVEGPNAARGDARYREFVALARAHGVLTPEDPYPEWPGDETGCVIAPLFLLYDYGFRPDHMPEDAVLAWAGEEDITCADEFYLHPDPFPSRQEWCRWRCETTERRLAAVPADRPTVLINHFPLRYDLVRLRRIPRFSPWCGTRATEDWHRRFRARVVVTGHLHVRGTEWRDGVRCEEVSLGYPRQWDRGRPIDSYLREILPGPPPP
jgi:predicted phosphodiesterase